MPTLDRHRRRHCIASLLWGSSEDDPCGADLNFLGNKPGPLPYVRPAAVDTDKFVQQTISVNLKLQQSTYSNCFEL